jgi:DTHCT (NUC029) region
MPLKTRTIAKGIPPRLHQPKTKGKPHTKTKKRPVSESESEDSDSEPLPVKKKARKKKKQHLNSDSGDEVELVEDAEPPEKQVEEADAGNDDGQPEVGDEEVSKILDSYTETYKILG